MKGDMSDSEDEDLSDSEDEDLSIPTHTLNQLDDPDQFLREDKAISMQNAQRLAKLRAQRCQNNVKWMVGKSAPWGVVPFGSIAASAMVYVEMDNILSKFGIPIRLQ